VQSIARLMPELTERRKAVGNQHGNPGKIKGKTGKIKDKMVFEKRLKGLE
jgi:hypothetical protein